MSYRLCIALFRALLAQGTVPTPQTTGRLLAVSPDMADSLAVVTLRETILGFVSPYLSAIWQRLVSLNTSLDFDVLGKVIRKNERFIMDVPSAGDRRVLDICLTLIKSKQRFTNPFELSSAGVVKGNCATAFICFWSPEDMSREVQLC
jgi:hypothetical protein